MLSFASIVSAQAAPAPAPSAPSIAVYKMMLASVAVMTNKFPRLENVRTAIAADCQKRAAMHPKPVDSVEYCYCAGVVSTALLMSYSDSAARTMIAGLMDDGRGIPEDVVPFQSPEMYSSICSAVVADRAAVRSSK
jgi:hypothetical protein